MIDCKLVSGENVAGQHRMVESMNEGRAKDKMVEVEEEGMLFRGQRGVATSSGW